MRFPALYVNLLVQVLNCAFQLVFHFIHKREYVVLFIGMYFYNTYLFKVYGYITGRPSELTVSTTVNYCIHTTVLSGCTNTVFEILLTRML